MKSSYIWVMGIALLAALVAGCEDKNKQIATAPPEQPPPPPERTIYPPENPGPPPSAPVASANPNTPANNDTYAPPVDDTHRIPPTDKPKTTARKPRPAPAEHYATDRPKAGQTYTVKKGDTLQEISQKFYGTSKKYQKIYQANKSKIKDPNKLTVGMKLTIPPK